ncbi:Opacity protein antigens [Jannaschia seosinensis]|uniref:Opacity protein antigens n=1 Tax=Jannaschia seosinensis TaxID=313367 RepID=A0A0M7BBE6_9RHOB|nr:outer membrane beta-barrel protein [Jannaschia seosinensis]CUH40050.1 Opacity protein antigens [Jannaschia seosinensis]
MKRFIPFLVLPLAATPALAGNMAPAPVEPAPVFTAAPAAPVYDFTGFYVGAEANYVDADTGGDLDLDGDGGMVGLRFGYDFAFRPGIVGGFVQYDDGDIDLELDGAGAGISLENVLRVGARAGVVRGANMFYGHGGYAMVETDNAGDADGYFLGAGYERFVTQNVTLGIEANYHEFDDFDGTSSGVDVDGDATTVGLNVNWRF